MEELKFVRYHSIENSYHKEDIERVYTCGFNTGDWVVTEKIHGSNFCFVCFQSCRSYFSSGC